MWIDILTAFPQMVEGPLQYSMLKRAVERADVSIEVHDLRQWAKDKHKTIDDSPYGGGAGMVFMVAPLYDALSYITKLRNPVNREIILTSPRGKLFSQAHAVRYSLLEHLIIICGHYKGVDERIKEFFPVTEISVGDYVLSGGELPALMITDATIRLIPGVMSDIDSAWSDSFNDFLLDCDYYTRPEVFKGIGVPQVLISGDHQKIARWRQAQREHITKQRRPDLYAKYKMKK